MKMILLLLLTMILLPSVVAVNITTDKTDYSQGEIVRVNINQCLQGSVLRVENANTPADLVYISQGNGNWQTTYNTNSDSSDGEYTLFASCEDRTTAELTFCVDAPGCTVEQPPAAGQSHGRSCQTNVTCGSYSFCNSTLQQARTCSDYSGCQPTRTEVAACSACEESWICSAWSGCQNGLQTRNCLDDHKCNTVAQKPVLQKSCQITVAPGPQPKQIVPNLPVVQQPAQVKSFWSKYSAYLPYALGTLVLLIVVVLGLVLYSRKHVHKAYNFNELKDWIQKEEGMGTSHDDIQQILSQETGWTGEEVSRAFKELHQNE